MPGCQREEWHYAAILELNEILALVVLRQFESFEDFRDRSKVSLEALEKRFSSYPFPMPDPPPPPPIPVDLSELDF